MMIKMSISIIAYLILAPFVGGLLTGVSRKISARMQGRIGPSLIQPFYDVSKAFKKETVTASKTQGFYVMLIMIFTLASGVVFFAGGNLMLAVFLLAAADAFLVIAAYSSNAPYIQADAESRLIRIMAYSPMLLLTAIGFYMYCGSFAVRDIVFGISMPLLPLIGIFISFLLALMIKHGRAPFHLRPYRQGGFGTAAAASAGLSGKRMGLMEICRWYESVLLSGFVFLFFANGEIWGYAAGVVVCILTYFTEALADNCFAAIKWQNVLKIAWATALIFGIVDLFALYMIV